MRTNLAVKVKHTLWNSAMATYSAAAIRAGALPRQGVIIDVSRDARPVRDVNIDLCAYR